VIPDTLLSQRGGLIRGRESKGFSLEFLSDKKFVDKPNKSKSTLFQKFL